MEDTITKLAVILFNILQLSIPLAKGSQNDLKCLSHSCQNNVTLMNCTDSRILISDVTTPNANHRPMALESLKRTCMGNPSCDSTWVCERPESRALTIHYLCVDANELGEHSHKCSRTLRIKDNTGYIQSPDYPSILQQHRPCRWRLTVEKDHLMIITLHDVHTNVPGVCDGGLMVSGHACDGEGHAYAPRLLCGGDAQSSFIRCGEVFIELSPSDVVYPLRFWLSFRIQPLHQPLSLGVPRCPEDLYQGPHLLSDLGIVSIGREVIETTMATTAVENPNTGLLVILLSIISGISVVLLIILIIVCIRCRLLQSPGADQIYSVPSPSLQAHLDYMTTLEASYPKARPQLADGYFEVADALPIALRTDNPASPAYAEVEQFAPLSQGPWPPSKGSDTSGSPPSKGGLPIPKGSPPPKPDLDGESEVNPYDTNAGGRTLGKSPKEHEETALQKSTDSITSAASDKKKPKRSVLGRLRGEKPAKDISGVSANRKLVKQARVHMSPLVPKDKKSSLDKNANDSDGSVYEDCTSSLYESIDVPPNHSSSSQSETSQVSPTLSSSPPSGNVPTSSDMVSPKTTNSVGSKPPPRSNTTATWKYNKSPSPDIKVIKSHPSSNKTKTSPTEAASSATVANVNDKTRIPTVAGKSNQRSRQFAAKRDVPQARGIVKNGIRLFEKNDATS